MNVQYILPCASFKWNFRLLMSGSDYHRRNIALGPKLVQYDHYCYMMQSNGATILVFYLMRMYRVIFEFALKRDSRDRPWVNIQSAPTH